MDDFIVTITEICIQKKHDVDNKLILRYMKNENVLALNQESDEIHLDFNELKIVAKEGFKLLEQWND